jgi:hypothetical protein
MPRWVCSDDPIPQDHIKLSEAFNLYYQAVTPNWRELDAAIDAANPPEGQISTAALRELDITRRAAFNARDTAYGKADVKFRAAITAGKLQPLIRDPATGELLKLSQNGWDREPNGLPGGFDEDFVEPGDAFQPGPPAVIDGYLRPVFFNLQDFKNWLRIVSGADDVRSKPLGRKRSYDRARVRSLVFEKMDYHGEFAPEDDEWKSQADLERAISDELARSGITPVESTVRILIREPLVEWRARKAGN